MINRKRKIEVENLSTKEVEHLSEQLGEKVKTICEKAAKEANELLNIYGLKAQLQISIDEINSKKEEN